MESLLRHGCSIAQCHEIAQIQAILAGKSSKSKGVKEIRETEIQREDKRRQEK